MVFGDIERLLAQLRRAFSALFATEPLS